MNFDNAIVDTMLVFPDFVGTCRKTDDTADNEPCWLVTFEERSVNGKEVQIEVILRDGGIVASILGTWHIAQSDARAIANTFINNLEFTPE
jgi:hypothetical protein